MINSVRILAVLGVLAAASGCTHLLTPLGGGVPVGGASLSVGEWSGTTAQGMPIAFTVGARGRISPAFPVPARAR
jgi:hypothetical protein